MIETIRKTGQAKRATGALHDAIHIEKAKCVGDNISQLTADLEQIKKENSDLEKKLKSRV